MNAPGGVYAPGGGPTMRAWGYCRVSSEGQAVEGVSLDAQRARIEAWCAARGAILVNILVDAGISGYRKENRPGLKAALAAVSPGAGAGARAASWSSTACHAWPDLQKIVLSYQR